MTIPMLLLAAVSAASAAAPAVKPLKVEILTTTPQSYSISPDASMSAVSGENAITVWSLAKGKPMFRIEAPVVKRVAPEDTVVFQSLSFSADGRWLLASLSHWRTASGVSTGKSVELLLVSIPEEKIVKSLAVYDGACVDRGGLALRCTEVRSPEFAADGRKVYFNGERRLEGGSKLEEFVVAIDLEGKKLLEETEINGATNRRYRQFKGFDADGRMLGLALDENTCALLDMTSGKRRAFLDGCTDKDTPQLSHEYGYVYSRMSKGSEFKIWALDGTLRSRIAVEPLKSADDTLYLEPLGDGRYASEYRRVRGGGTEYALWDVKARRKIAASADKVFEAVYGFALTPDRLHAAFSTGEKIVYVRVDAGTRLAPSLAQSMAAVDATVEPAAPVAAPAPAAPARSYDSPPASAGKADPDAYAVIIGVEKYRAAGIPRVDYAARDAKTMYDYATAAMGFDAKNVILLTDEQATKTDFEKNLGSWLKNRVGAKSRVFVYYAGHGSPNPTTGEGYLMPYEADPNYLEDTAYPVAKLYASLAKLPTMDVTVVLDACFSGTGGRSLIAKGARPLVSVVTAKAASNTVVLAAAESSQISASNPERRHGLLTSYLLEALSGAADSDSDGRIMSSEVYEFVRPAVERAARLQNLEQTPTMTPSLEILKTSPGRPWIELPAKK